MEVIELITALNEFTFGRSDFDEKDKGRHLLFLNLANDAAFPLIRNSQRLKYDIKVYFEKDEFEVDLPDLYIHNVRNNQGYLDTYNIKSELAFNITNSPEYRLFNNKLQITKSVQLISEQVPYVNAGATYLYLEVAPKLKKLVQVVNDNELETSIPIYPKEFHLGLIYGAAYLSMLSQYGYVEYIKYAKENWERFLINLTNYYKNDV